MRVGALITIKEVRLRTTPEPQAEGIFIHERFPAIVIGYATAKNGSVLTYILSPRGCGWCYTDSVETQVIG